MSQFLLETSCVQLRGVGKNLAELLAKLDIYTLQDLLFHLPLRYQDRTHITPIRDMKVGNEALIHGTITNRQHFFKPRMQCVMQITDGSGVCYVRLFHFTKAQLARLQVGTHIQCFGEARLGRYGIELVHPEYHLLAPQEVVTLNHTLTPVYPTTEGIGQTTWRRLTDQALAVLNQNAAGLELLPASLRERYGLADLHQALLFVHRPPPDANQQALLDGKHPMQQRLAFEELLAHQLCLRLFRQKVQQLRAPCLPLQHQLIPQFLQVLPFTLTQAQQRVFEEVSQDMHKTVPMLRLVQGDVGSGKTVIAALAALLATENGWQAALMAPTEILAEQHYHNFCRWLQPLGLDVSWLSGRTTGKARKNILSRIANGETHIIIGTHALFQKDVDFKQLGVVIVDEQHRFGVEQRLALRNKSQPTGLFPHQLIMTATPIPRTLAMTSYADLDISVIDQLPPGRKPVTTVVISNNRREDVIERIREAALNGQQVYWVCTLIDESDVLQCQAAESTAQLLQEALGENIKVGLVHGRLTPSVKEAVMQDFKAGNMEVLVATTVIEVGVDVPNASLMVIENPERLGLSQLHQLRGRVGRGSLESYCVLMYQAPLSNMARERLAVMRESNDGFVIAERDLALRGPGELLGTRQTGEVNLQMANLQRDMQLLPPVQQAATVILEQFGTLTQPLISRWIGKAEQYGMV